MNNILILGAGGPAGIGVIKSLRKTDFDINIISIDCNELSAGFHMSDKYFVVPKVESKSYLKKVLKIVEKEKIDLILPTTERDIVKISKNKNKFKGVTLFMSDYKTIMNCSDKLKFYNKCKNKFDLPETFDEFDFDFPIFCKPKMGSGSRGTRLCTDMNCIKLLEETFSPHRSSDYVFQEYLPGQEYTIDVLCDMNSNPLVAVPRKRLQTKAGISSKGTIIKDNFIEKACFDICKFLKLKGPVCIQMKEDENKKLKFVEVNTRAGGGSYFATLAGVNFYDIILKIVNGIDFKIPDFDEITVLRYFNEVVV